MEAFHQLTDRRGLRSGNGAVSARGVHQPASGLQGFGRERGQEAGIGWPTLPDAGRSGAATAAAAVLTAAVPETLGECLERLTAVQGNAAADAAFLGFQEAADFAGLVEELSRSVEYLQLVAAQAVDRTRNETLVGSAGANDADGFRGTAEFLRTRLRIGIGEARRRLALADSVLPRRNMTGQSLPPRHEEVAEAVGSARISSRAATIVTTTLDRAAHHSTPEAVATVELALTRTAVNNDQDFLSLVARRWADA